MSSQRILTAAQPTTSQIDAMIRQMEVTLGKEHTKSPFTPIYQKYGFSTQVEKPAVQEETKEELVKVAVKEATPEVAKPEEETKDQEPKEEKKPKEAKVQQPKGNKGGKQAAAPAVDENLSEELKAFLASDLRVGKIVECTRHPESAKLYIEKIDLGEGRLRTIGSGLQEFVSMEQMTEGLCVVFANLKPRKLADIMSEGMVMCAGNEDHTVIEIMRPPAGSKVGDRVVLDGNPAGEMPQDFQAVLNPKKKIAEKVLPLLSTNSDKEGTFNGIKLITSSGVIKSNTLTNCRIS